ncbi:hypothetical protein [Shimia sp. R9_3]|uniref:hypothetical protein n=1 Tax=Shimia sp. R9_3 TaxID=2821113 RepID=UPI001FFE240C|nr:hypothetical protein [Shimia sp. R9_3]
MIIEGVDARTYAALERVFAPLLSVPVLPLKRFERAVMLAENIPNIDLSTEIDFPTSNGARLRVLVEEQAKSAGTATLDNPPRELGEALSLYLAQEFYSTFAVGDLLRLEASGTINWDQDNEESLWGALTYRLPLHSNGLYGELYYGSVNARRDICGSFARTEIDGENLTLALGYPVVRDVESYGYLLLDYRLSQSDSESGGVPLSSEADVIGLTYLYGKSFASGGALEAGATLSYGETKTAIPHRDLTMGMPPSGICAAVLDTKARSARLPPIPRGARKFGASAPMIDCPLSKSSSSAIATVCAATALTKWMGIPGSALCSSCPKATSQPHPASTASRRLRFWISAMCPTTHLQILKSMTPHSPPSGLASTSTSAETFSCQATWDFR